MLSRVLIMVVVEQQMKFAIDRQKVRDDFHSMISFHLLS